MAVAKVCGIETEYGIHPSGRDANPIASSSCSSTPTSAELARVIGWDFEDETPRQRRPRLRPGGRPCPRRSRPTWPTPCSPTAPATTSTTPTRSTPRPSARPPRGRRSTTRPGEEVLRRSMASADGPCRRARRSSSTRTTPTARATPTARHENYLMDRACPSPASSALITPHFVTRQIFTGAGKVGCETAGRGGDVPAFQLTPARRVLRGGGRPRDHAEAADHQHPRRAPRRSPAVPPPARHHRRRQPVRGGDLPQAGHHRPGAGHDRGRRLRRRSTWPSRDPVPGHAARSPSTRPCRTVARAWPTAGR